MIISAWIHDLPENVMLILSALAESDMEMSAEFTGGFITNQLIMPVFIWDMSEQIMSKATELINLQYVLDSRIGWILQKLAVPENVPSAVHGVCAVRYAEAINVWT